jgi:hypothetical protein
MRIENVPADPMLVCWMTAAVFREFCQNYEDEMPVSVSLYNVPGNAYSFTKSSFEGPAVLLEVSEAWEKMSREGVLTLTFDTHLHPRLTFSTLDDDGEEKRREEYHVLAQGKAYEPEHWIDLLVIDVLAKVIEWYGLD